VFLPSKSEEPDGSPEPRLWKIRASFRRDVRVPTTVTMKTNISLSRVQGPDMPLPSSVKNMEELLRHLGEKINFLFIDGQTGKLRPDIDILVNGKEIWFYPEGLKRAICDRDSIEITLIPLGGG
jgi:hypothetical protein